LNALSAGAGGSAYGVLASRIVHASVDGEEAATNFGFMAKLVMLDLSASSVLTRERTDWKPTHPSVIGELKAGKPNYY
jgi:hypothetical protein